jgi:hypothetical protein
MQKEQARQKHNQRNPEMDVAHDRVEQTVRPCPQVVVIHLISPITHRALVPSGPVGRLDST